MSDVTDPRLPAYMAALAPILADVVDPAAADVDRTGAYPRAALDALGRAGPARPDQRAGGRRQRARRHRAATAVVQALAEHCGSTAMVADDALRRRRPSSRRFGRRPTCGSGSPPATTSPRWPSPRSGRAACSGRRCRTAVAACDGRSRLDAQKSWVTSAGEADGYVWSSKPLAAEGASTLWLVPADADGLKVGAPFDGLGLRGNASSPMSASGVRGAGVGHARRRRRRVRHHAGRRPALLPGHERRLLDRHGQRGDGQGRAPRRRHPLRAPRPGPGRQPGRPGQRGPRCASVPTQPRPCSSTRLDRPGDGPGRRHAAGPGVQGGCRRGRASRSPTWPCECAAAPPSARRSASSATSATPGPPSVMAPTTDALYDFIGRIACGLPALLMGQPSMGPLLMGAVAYDPKVVTIWDGFRDWFADQGFDFDYVLYSNYERQVEALLAGHIDVAWNSPLAWVRARPTRRRRARPSPCATPTATSPRWWWCGPTRRSSRRRRPVRPHGGGRRGRLAAGHADPARRTCARWASSRRRGAVPRRRGRQARRPRRRRARCGPGAAGRRRPTRPA